MPAPRHIVDKVMSDLPVSLCSQETVRTQQTKSHVELSAELVELAVSPVRTCGYTATSSTTS